MHTLARQLVGTAKEYKPGLMLLAAVFLAAFAVDWWLTPIPHSTEAVTTAINRVYSTALQPLVCLPSKTVPTR